MSKGGALHFAAAINHDRLEAGRVVMDDLERSRSTGAGLERGKEGRIDDSANERRRRG
jgi:hypothetical protein